MRESEFNRLVAEEFGEAYGPMVAASHRLGEFEDRTAQEAIAAGVPARQVWEALCEDFDVPPERRLGRDRPIVDHPFD